MTRPATRPVTSTNARGIDLNGLVSAWRSQGKLISIAQVPAGVSTYACFEDEQYTIQSVQLVDGHVVVRGHDTRFGDMVTAMLGGATIEVLAHPDVEARDAYEAHVVTVDAENRENALEAVRTMVGAVWAEMGVEVEPAPEDGAEGQEDAIEGETAGGSSGAT